MDVWDQVAGPQAVTTVAVAQNANFYGSATDVCPWIFEVKIPEQQQETKSMHNSRVTLHLFRLETSGAVAPDALPFSRVDHLRPPPTHTHTLCRTLFVRILSIAAPEAVTVFDLVRHAT